MTKLVGDKIGSDCISYQIGLVMIRMAETNDHPLAQYRRRRGITQEALATELGVWPLTVWRWENGERTPRMKDAKRVAEHTGIPLGDILSGVTAEASQ